MTRILLNIAALLSAPVAIFGLYAPWAQLLRHASDKRWPDHARFHVTWAAGKLFALGVCQLLLITIPFRGGQRWSWFAMASNLVFGGLSILPASRIMHGPIPRLSKHNRSTQVLVACMLSGILGLALGFFVLFFGQA